MKAKLTEVQQIQYEFVPVREIEKSDKMNFTNEKEKPAIAEISSKVTLFDQTFKMKDSQPPSIKEPAQKRPGTSSEVDHKIKRQKSH